MPPGRFPVPKTRKKKSSSSVLDTIANVVGDVGDVAADVIHGVESAAEKVGHVASDVVSTAEHAVPAAQQAVHTRQARAQQRQAELVQRYVTQAYSRKKAKIKQSGAPGTDIQQRIERAKDEVNRTRERLLNNPTVQAANEQGKVVPPKGLHKIQRRAAQYHAIQGPKGVSRSKEFGFEPRSLSVGPKGAAQLATATGFEGRVARMRNKAELEAHAKTEPSTLEVLSIASAGVPGVGVAPDIARLGALGAKAIPGLLTREGASGVAARVGAKAAATKALPAKAASSVRELPAVLRGSPEALRAAAKAAPKAVRGAPAAAGRGAVRSAGTTYKASGGTGLLASTQAAGDNPVGQRAEALLKGTSAALGNHFGETAGTTLRALPAVVTAPGALAYTAGEIPFEGTGPFEETAKAQLEGLKQIGANLLSGDPHRVQEAVQGEGALALLAPVPALTRTAPYRAFRGKLREGAAGVRRTMHVGRQVPKGHESNVLGITEGRETRKRVATTHTRAANPFRVSEAAHTQRILHGTQRRPALSSAPNPEVTGHALQTLLDYGIRDMEGVKLVRQRGPKTEPHVEGRVNLDKALRIAEEHPDIFTNKPYMRSLRAAERASKTTPAALNDAGNVARYRSQGDLFGVRPPEKRTPVKAREFTNEPDREGAWKDLERMEKRVVELKRKARAKGTKSAKAPRRRAEVEALEAKIKGLRRTLDPFVRPGAKSLSSEKRVPWDKALEREYIREVEAKRKGSPLVEPAWTHHATFRTAKMGIEGKALPGTAGGKQYVRKGSLAENDLVDRSLEALIRGTVQMPRRRGAGATFGREFVRSEKVPYTLGGKARYVVPDSETWAKITAKKTKENPEGGQIDPKLYARFPIRQWKSAVRDPFTSESDLMALVSEAEAGRLTGHEPSLIVPRESIREFSAALNPERGPVTEFGRRFSIVSSRSILATNPAWAIAQIPAEGIPLALAHPELLYKPHRTGSILKDLHEFRETHPEEAAIIEGVAGASPQITAGTLKSPLDLEREATYNPQPAAFADGAKAMTRSKFGRAIRSTAKLELLGLFDVKRQNAYRSVLLAAEADKRFRNFTSGMRGMFRSADKLSGKFRGKSREELWIWLTTTKEGKVELNKLADYVDNVQGNWTAFTRYEKAFAPLVIFYPFLRYSLRWALWTFPKTHPITATIALMLGQANANELEKLLGAKPASPLAYAYPVIKDAEGKSSVLPGGSRISPGQSAPQQALASGQASQLLGVLNPFLGAAVTALGGPGPFGQKPSGPAGWAAVDQLLAMPAPLRILSQKIGGSQNFASLFGVGHPEPKSIIARAFEKLDPKKAERQILWPPLPQSAKNAKLSNQLSRALKEASANSKSKREDVAGDESLTVAVRKKKIKTMEGRADRAKSTIDGILKGLGLDKEDEEAYERFKESLYGSESGGGIYDSGSLYEKGSIYESGGIYGGGNKKALKYKPPGVEGISLPGIDLPLGAIGNTLSNLLLGETAQAAERRPAKEEKTLTGPLTPGQKVFAKTLAKETKLSPRVAGAWALAEQSGDAAKQREAEGNHNWLNIGYSDSGPMGLTADKTWSSPKLAAKATAEFLKGQKYGASAGIQSILSARGKGPQAQIEAIGKSGWATNPAYTQSIAGTFSLVGVKAKKPLPKKVMNRFHAGVVAAKELEKAKLPYVWGGGHGDPASRPTGGGLDCSGAVSYVLNKMGVLKGSLTSGDMGSVLRPGPGAVTVFYNPEHTFMRIGKKYFGTSNANPSGGAGFIPGSVAGPEAASGSYNVGHVAGLGKKVAVALGIPTGATGASASTSFPGMTLSDGGTVATLTSSGTTVDKPGFSNKPIKLSPGQRLNVLNQILSGDLSRFGIPSDTPRGRPSGNPLALLGQSLESQRQQLMRL